MNFSEIGNLPALQQRGFLFESVSQIELGAMPLPQYTALHRDARVTPEQLATLKKYLADTAAKSPSTPQQIQDATDQYQKWIAGGGAALAQNVAPAPNGIAFMPDYKNWRAISSTDRWDNNTLRQVLGNDIAIKAIAENHINPWPDGAAFAKVAWFKQRDGNGNAKTGPFYQVEFMLRDSTKYAKTLGWGWSRWRGADLKPYGKDANFTAECVGCHSPLANTNYVFTEPLRGGQ